MSAIYSYINEKLLNWAGRKFKSLQRRKWRARQWFRQAVFEYIEVFYNRERRHSVNGYLSPVNYDSQCKAA